MVETGTRTTQDGLNISVSEIKRLETELKNLKVMYDSLKIKQLTRQGQEKDAAT